MNPATIIAITAPRGNNHQRRDREIGPMEGFFVFALIAIMLAMLVHMYLMGRKLK